MSISDFHNDIISNIVGDEWQLHTWFYSPLSTLEFKSYPNSGRVRIFVRGISKERTSKFPIWYIGKEYDKQAIEKEFD